MHNKKHETNTELINRVCKYSDGGALAQAFLIDALGKAAQRVLDVGLDELRRQMKHSMIHADAWWGVANEWHEEIEKHLWVKPKESAE